MSHTPRGVLPQYFAGEGYAAPQVMRAVLLPPSFICLACLQPFPEAREKQIANIETSGMSASVTQH